MIAEALVCLAMNVYHEARNQPSIGQLAVAQVVMNRVKDKRYPDTVCNVVMQGRHYDNGHPAKHQCQFSWYCDGKSDEPKDDVAWKHSLDMAEIAIRGYTEGFMDGATHYHTTEVSPSWATYKRYIVRINDHIFYRWD